MKKTIFLFLGFFLFLACSKKKLDLSERVVDSIPIYLSLAYQDTISYQDRLSYNERAFQLTLRHKNDSLHRRNLFKVADRYFNLNNMEKFHEISKIALQRSIISKDSVNIAKAYSNIGEYYLGGIGNADSSFTYYKKAEKLYLKLNNKINLASTYLSIAILQNKINDYIGSERSAIKVLDLLKGTTGKYEVYEAYNIIAITAKVQNDFKRCLKYHDRALEVANSNLLPKEFHSKAVTFNNIGTVFHGKKDYKKAMQYYEKGLKERDLFIDKPYAYALLLDNLAYSKFWSRDYSGLPGLFYESLKIRDSLSLFSGSILTRTRLSEFYSKTGDTIKSKKYAVEALSLSRKSKLQQSLLISLNQLATVDAEKASIYREEYIQLSDSLYLEERKMQNKFARIEFETDEIISEKDKTVGQIGTILWVAIAIILTGLLFYTIKMQQSKKRELLLLQSRQRADQEIYQLMLEQQEKFDQGREKEKKRMARELHDRVMDRLKNIRSNLFVLESKTDPETIEHCIQQVSQIQEVEKEVRSIAHDLSYDAFSLKNDYAELLKALAKEFADETALKIDLKFSDAIDWETLTAAVKISIYRLLQDCLQDIKKHTAATQAAISIAEKNRLIRIEIQDNDSTVNSNARLARSENGNMQSRIEEMNGNFEIIASNSGTSIKISIPI